MIIEVLRRLDERLVEERGVFDLAVFQRVQVIEREKGAVLTLLAQRLRLKSMQSVAKLLLLMRRALTSESRLLSVLASLAKRGVALSHLPRIFEKGYDALVLLQVAPL